MLSNQALGKTDLSFFFNPDEERENGKNVDYLSKEVHLTNNMRDPLHFTNVYSYDPDFSIAEFTHGTIITPAQTKKIFTLRYRAKNR